MARYPRELVIRVLAQDEWHLVAGRFEAECAAMPTNRGGNVFYGVFLGSVLIGFGHLEQLLHLNAVYIDPEYRNGPFATALIKTMDADIGHGQTAVIHPRRRWQRILKRFGFYATDTPGVWRKDY